jgi:hypothetical protein
MSRRVRSIWGEVFGWWNVRIRLTNSISETMSRWMRLVTMVTKAAARVVGPILSQKPRYGTMSRWVRQPKPGFRIQHPASPCRPGREVVHGGRLGGTGRSAWRYQECDGMGRWIWRSCPITSIVSPGKRCRGDPNRHPREKIAALAATDAIISRQVLTPATMAKCDDPHRAAYR